MREIDPVTQCEIIRKRRSPLLATMMMYMAFAGPDDLMPKKPKINNYPPWYSISLSKSERESLTYEEAQELKRYRWTLKRMRDRND